MPNAAPQSDLAVMYAVLNVLVAICVGIGWIDGITVVSFYWLETGVVSLYGIAARLCLDGVGAKHQTPFIQTIAGAIAAWIFHGLFLHFMHVEVRDSDLNLTRNPLWVVEWMDQTAWLVLALLVIGHGVWRFRAPGVFRATPILPLARLLKFQLALMVGGFYWTQFHNRDAGLFVLVGANLVDLVRERRESRKQTRAPAISGLQAEVARDDVRIRRRLTRRSDASNATAGSSYSTERSINDEDRLASRGRKTTSGDTPNLKD